MRTLRAAWVAFRRKRLYARVLRPPAALVVLRYHSVGEPAEVAEYLDPALSIPPDLFRRQIRFLRERFDIVPLDAAALAAPRGRRPRVAITFDDGYRDNHDVAVPILREEGASATFYVTTGPLGSGRGLWISELWRLSAKLPAGRVPVGPGFDVTDAPDARFRVRRALTAHLAALSATEREAALDALAARAGVERAAGLGGSFMTPEHLRALARHGMTVGAHTRTHPHLSHAGLSLHDDEVLGSRADLEAILGLPVLHFAYPNPGGSGTPDGPARSAVARAGFATAVTSTTGAVGPGVDPLLVPRLGVYAGPQADALFAALDR